MKSIDIRNLIDGLILKHLYQNKSKDDDLESLTKDLDYRYKTIFKAAEKDYKTIDNLLSTNIDDIKFNLKYVFYYVYHCKQRIEDLNWMIRNKEKFNYTYIKMFKLIKLKDKLKKNETK